MKTKEVIVVEIKEGGDIMKINIEKDKKPKTMELLDDDVLDGVYGGYCNSANCQHLMKKRNEQGKMQCLSCGQIFD